MAWCSFKKQGQLYLLPFSMTIAYTRGGTRICCSSSLTAASFPRGANIFTNEALTTESRRYKCYTRSGGNVTH